MIKSVRLALVFALSVLGYYPAAAQWIEQDSDLPDHYGLRDIDVVSSSVVWAVAYFGLVPTDPSSEFTRTTDGGTTWRRGRIPGVSAYSFVNVSAVSDQLAWVAMDDNTNGGGAILHTTNGGATWVRQAPAAFPAASGGFVNGIYMQSATTGVAVGDPVNGYFEIYTTTTGGTTWTRVPSASIPAPLNATEYGVAETVVGMGNNVWFATSEGRVLRSTNGGLTWAAATTGIGATGITNLAFSDATHGIAYLDGATAIYRTADGGATWTSFTPSGPVYDVQVSAVPGTLGAYVSVGVEAGVSGSSFSLDHGTTWTTIDNTIPYTAVDFLNAQTGWAGGFVPAFGAGGVFAGSLPTPPPPIPDWLWGRRFGGTAADFGNHLVADNAGNTYATGYFTNTVAFGATTLVGAGRDAYLVKLNPAGAVQWARQISGPGADEATNIALSPGGDVFITGTYSGTISFVGSATTLTSQNASSDIFVACYSPAGVLRWAHSIGGTAEESAPVLTIAGARVVVAGTFESPTIELAGGTFQQVDNGDLFVVSLSATGTEQWGFTDGGTATEFTQAITAAPNGDVLLSGTFDGFTSLNGWSYSSADHDPFLMRIDDLGASLWVLRGSGSTGNDFANAVAVDAAGNAYMTGPFNSGSITFGAVTLTRPINNINLNDMYVLKCDPNGTLLWARRAVVSRSCFGNSLAVSSTGDLYVAGNFSGSVTFGVYTLNSIPVGSVPFVAVYNAAGQPQWGRRVTDGTPVGASLGIALDASANAYVVGRFNSTLTFGPDVLTTAGDYDIFVAKLGTSCALGVPTVTASATSLCAGQSLTLTATNLPANTTRVWTGPNNFTSTQATVTIPNATAAASGTYTLTVTSAALGCSVSSSVTVTVGAVPAVPVATNTPRCGPGPVVLSATGAPAGGAYSWYTTATGGTPISGATGNTYTTPSLSATTTYYVSSVSAAGCAGPRASVAATINPAPAPTISASGPTTFCQGGTVTLTAAAGGAGATYQFLRNGIPVSGGTGTSYAATVAGLYTVVATLPSGCPGTSATSVTVQVSAAPAAPATTAATRCGTGSVTLTASGAPAGGTYRWYSSATGGSPISGATGNTYNTPSLSATTTYYVSAVATGGCEGPRAPVSAVIAAPPVAQITAGGATTICQGSSVVLTASAGASYQWSNGLTTPSITVSTGGTYFVTVTSLQGCAATSAAVPVTVTPRASAAFAYAASTYCLGAGGTAVPAITGTAGGTFSASPVGLTINATTGALNLATSQAGTYTVTYAVAGSCPDSASTSLSVTPAPLAAFSYPVSSACGGTVAVLQPTLNSGASAGSFTATPAGLTLDAATGAISLGTSQANTYTITNTLTASGNCPTATAMFTVNAVPPTPTITPTGSGPVTLTSSATTGNQWFYNGQPIAGATGTTYLVTSSAQNGTYSLQTTSPVGCASALSATVTVTVTSTVADLPGTSLLLFPNPTADGRLTLELTGYQQVVALTLHDAVGRVLYSQTLAATSGERTQYLLELHALPAGVYSLRATTQVGTVVRRLVRE